MDFEVIARGIYKFIHISIDLPNIVILDDQTKAKTKMYIANKSQARIDSKERGWAKGEKVITG